MSRVFYMNTISPKVVFVGNARSGKTTTIRSLFTNKATSKYVSTIGLELHVWGRYKIWDCAGKPDYLGLGSGYYYEANIVIVFNGGEAFREPETWESEVRKIAPNAQVFHISGSVKEKLQRVKEILA